MSIGIDLDMVRRGTPGKRPRGAAHGKSGAPALVRDALQKGNPRTLRPFSRISTV
jgi:hypothetical protein